LINVLEQMRREPLHVFIREQGNHFRVVHQRHYPNDVLEEVVFTQRFETAAEAQSYADAGLRAQRIYRDLTPHRSLDEGGSRTMHGSNTKMRR
jgi:hypothetical protein